MSKTKAELMEELDQLRTQLAGCSVAALGATMDQPAQKGDYGWSPAYQDVLDLREKYLDLRAGMDLPGPISDQISLLYDRLGDRLNECYTLDRNLSEIPAGLDDFNYEAFAGSMAATAQIMVEKMRADLSHMVSIVLELRWLYDAEERAERYVKRCMEEDEIPRWQIRQEGNAIQHMQSLVHYYKQLHHGTERAFGQVVEHSAVTMRAMEMLTRLNHGGYTHRQRDRFSEATVMACQEALDELLHLRNQGIDSFGWESFQGRSFEFQRVAQRNHHLEVANKQLVERNRGLEQEVKRVERRRDEVQATLAAQEGD